MTVIHINVAKYVDRSISRTAKCGFCGLRGVTLVFSQPWYGLSGVHLCCGRRFISSEYQLLPRGRNATTQREKNKEWGRMLWRSMKDKPTTFLGRSKNAR